MFLNVKGASILTENQHQRDFVVRGVAIIEWLQNQPQTEIRTDDYEKGVITLSVSELDPNQIYQVFQDDHRSIRIVQIEIVETFTEFKKWM